MPRVALCFFGLVKQFSHVAESLEEYILAPLRAAGYEYECFAHTYQMTRYENSRNGEATGVNPRSIEALKGIKVKYSDPFAVDALRPLEYYLQHGDPWPNNPRQSMRYFIRQLYSLKQVTGLWKSRAADFTYVLYLRPDTRFYTPLQLPTRLEGLTVLIPDFHSFRGYNDRFALGTPEVMITYGERFDQIPVQLQKYKLSLHAERFLKRVLDDAGVQVLPCALRFGRVRATGKVVEKLSAILGSS